MFGGDRRTKLLTLGAMCFALFMAMLDNTVVNLALPTIQRHFGSGVSGLQWVIDAYTLMFASLLLTGGTLGDLFGRKRAFLVGLSIFTVGSLAAGLAPTMSLLIVARGIQGLGAAALMPGTLAILTNTFPDERERAQAIGIWAGVSGLALALGPLVGGWLVDTLGWQSVFFINIPVGIVALFVATRVVAESADPTGRRVDLPGQLLAVAWLGSLTYALIEGNGKGWTSPLILGLLGAAAVGFVVFIVVEIRSSSPMLRLTFFRNPTFSAANGVAFLISFGMFGMFFFFSLFLQEIQGYSVIAAGVRSLPMTGAIIVSAPLAGRLAGKVGSRVPMSIGLGLMGGGLLLFERVQATTPFGSFWWVLIVMGIGMGLTMTPMTAAVMSTVPRQRAGMASATTSTSREVGGVFGIALLGAIVTARFTSVLERSLAAAGVPTSTSVTIAHAVTHGAGTRTSSPIPLPPAERAALVRMIGDSFMSGMHLALLVAGTAILIGAVLAFVFVQRDRVPAMEASEAATLRTRGVEPVRVRISSEE